MKKNEDNQTIKCTVDSCKYYDEDSKCCELKKIDVEKQSGCKNCNCKEETICASYKKKPEE